MSTYTRPKTRRQLRHPASRSKSHRLDKQQGDARRQTEWIGLDAPERPSPARSFTGLTGHEYTFADGQWRRCDGPEEFADYLETQRMLRSWFRDRTQRQGVPVTMRREVKHPLDFATTTFPPWLSDWTAAEIAAGRDPRPKLAAIRHAWLPGAQKMFEGERFVLGYAFHADTDDLHFDLALSRQDGEGGRIGATGLHLVGPWCVGVDRQIRAGADVRAEKRSQMRRSVANFRRRYGEDAVPLDVTLARALDAAADTVLGAELTPYREAYARRVPELERQHAAAELAKVDAAQAQLRQWSAPAPSPEITPG